MAISTLTSSTEDRTGSASEHTTVDTFADLAPDVTTADGPDPNANNPEPAAPEDSIVDADNPGITANPADGQAAVDQAGPADATASAADDGDTDNGDGEFDRIIYVPPESVRIEDHIRNDNAEPTREEVKDYEKNGVEEAIKAYRDPEGSLVLVKGKRRLLAAIKASVALVPVWVQPPPSEDEKAARIDLISKQYRWTRHRKGLTRRDEFRVFQQLKLDGLSVTAIAKTLSVSRRAVTDSLKVGASELAAAAADKYDMTLEQAAEVAECERLGELDAAKKLIQTAAEAPHNFKTFVQRLRDDRDAAEKLRKSVAACTDQLAAAGVPILDESMSDWTGQARSLDRLRPGPEHEPGTALTPDDHATCPGHSAWVRHTWTSDGDKVAAAVYACSDFRAHGHALLHAPECWVDLDSRFGDGASDETDDRADGSDGVNVHGTNDGTAGRYGGSASTDTADSVDVDPEVVAAAQAAQREAELARRTAEIEENWRVNNTKDAKASQSVRQEFLADFAARKSIPKGARKWLALRTLAGSQTLWEAMDSGHPLAHRLLGMPEPELADNDWTTESDYHRSELFERIDSASDSKAAVYELYLVLCAFEGTFRVDSWHMPTETDRLHITMLIDLGYAAPDIDRKVLNPDKLEDVIAAALEADAEADADPHAPSADDDSEDGAVDSAADSTAASSVEGVGADVASDVGDGESHTELAA